ncbi:MAG: hypothetical protein LBH04_00455 [Tannerellaceae bacterium]|nr:hypothetical protein [Tannerellaceae bacterium]
MLACDRSVGKSRLFSRRATTAQSASHDCSVGKLRLFSRRVTTVQSAIYDCSVGDLRLVMMRLVGRSAVWRAIEWAGVGV